MISYNFNMYLVVAAHLVVEGSVTQSAYIYIYNPKYIIYTTIRMSDNIYT